MPGIPNLSLVEGAFEELAAELATYLDTLKGEGSNVSAEVTPLLSQPADPEKEEAQSKETDKDAVLKKLVTASSVLNSAPERELQAAYNLLIHLISQAPEPDKYLARVCQYLVQPITSSPQNGTGIAMGILGTLFNTLQPDDDTRYHVLLAIVELMRRTGSYEIIRPQLKSLDAWIAEWEEEPAEARKLYQAVSDAAAAANEPEESYIYLLKALRTTQDEPSSQSARELSLKALKSALQSEHHFDFQDLTSLDSIQALRKSDEAWLDLLELFVDQTFEDLADFKDGNGSFIADNGLDEDVLDRKMRLLTLATLCAQSGESRTVTYSQIAKALRIPDDETEMWVIDCIRSGLVEGRLSQQKQEFLIHRATHRTFGEKQWREVASRLETWRASLTSVLATIRREKEEFVREKEAEIAGPEVGRGGQGYRPDRRQRNQGQALEVE
jgi:translation initiation factor 3 subunit M